MTDRRRKLTAKEKDAILARQGGVCPGLPHLRLTCGKALTRQTAVFDHIEQRVFTKNDDIREFQALCTGALSCNWFKTYGLPGAGSAGSDANKRAKIRRGRKKRKAEAARMEAKRKGDKAPRKAGRRIASRGFTKGHRPLRSRNDLRRS